jgi:hypothetical protein
MAGEEGKKYIVIAEDEADIRGLVSAFASAAAPGVGVIEAENGEIAMRRISEILEGTHGEVSFILFCDGEMGGPGKDGADVYLFMRGNPTLKDSPFILASGGMNDADTEFFTQIARSDNNFSLFQKPFKNIDDVMGAIRSAISKATP